MRGYKIFNANWQCRGLQYCIGETTTHVGEVIPCVSGLHFCTTALACLNYYQLDPSNKYAEIVADVNCIQSRDKWAAASIEVVREIPFDEFRKMCTGELKRWYTTGQIELSAMYTEGLLDGLTQEWYATGRPRTRIDYVAGAINGTFEMWYPSGQIKSYCCYVHNLKNGLEYKWLESGKLLVPHEYNLGVWNGAI